MANGPQIGLLALQAVAYSNSFIYLLDVLGAESQGMIGYLLVQALMNQLISKPIGTLLTQVEVSLDDPAFKKLSKFIGPLYSHQQANKISTERGWQFARDGKAYRRVVPSPVPKKIVEINLIETLIDSSALIICVGGGGIPVTRDKKGNYSGVEAVIDKDLLSALLESNLKPIV